MVKEFCKMDHRLVKLLEAA